MSLLPITDPRSFAIPITIALLIQVVVLGSLSTQWMNPENHFAKVPAHIAARVVHLEKPKPEKKKVVSKPEKKPAAVKKPVPKKAEKPKPKDKPKPKPPEKKVVPTKAKPKVEPKPLPAVDLDQALKDELAMNEMDAMLENELQALQSDKDEAAISDYSSQIKALIQRAWRFPPSARHDEVVVLRIFLVPTGEVTEVQLVESSGNLALDRSAEQAVWKVARLPVPEDAALFDREFRQFVLNLRPENARL